MTNDARDGRFRGGFCTLELRVLDNWSVVYAPPIAGDTELFNTVAVRTTVSVCRAVSVPTTASVWFVMAEIVEIRARQRGSSGTCAVPPATGTAGESAASRKTGRYGGTKRRPTVSFNCATVSKTFASGSFTMSGR